MPALPTRLARIAAASHAALLVTAMAGYGCNDGPAAPTMVVQGVTWKLEAIERTGSATIAIANPELYTLVFEADGRLNVRADCNTCNGRYTLDRRSLSTSQVACTRAFCGTAIDVTFAMALGEVRTVTVNGSQLLLEGPGLTLRFRS
jgi:heat shock protein HslJ